MARPKNVLFVVGKMVYSTSPGKLKEILTAKAAGLTPALPEAKAEVGEIFANLSPMTQVEAEAMLATLAPPPTPAPEVVAAPVAAPAVETMPAPAPTETATATV